MATESIPYTDRQSWLAARRQGIGGSDAAAAVGLSKWRTPLELYLDKRGELEVTETEPMRWGTLLEPVVRQEYANRTGREVHCPGVILRHPRVTFALLNPDGIVPGERLYEGKTARTAEGWGEPGSADIPQEYLLQVQHGLFVTGLPVADVAVLIGGNDFRVYEVPADAELQEMLIDREAEFWRHVEEGTPPEPLNREDVKRRWQISSGAAIRAQQDTVALVKQLSRAKQLAKAVEERIDELAATIQEEMGEAAELQSPEGKTLATWKNITINPRFDLERFKAEQPDLFRQYLKPAAPQRRFLLAKAANVAANIDTATKRLLSLGGTLRAESESGSRYFDLPGGLRVRLADHDPNEATAAWMQREEVASVRVDQPDWQHQLEAITGPALIEGSN